VTVYNEHITFDCFSAPKKKARSRKVSMWLLALGWVVALAMGVYLWLV